MRILGYTDSYYTKPLISTYRHYLGKKRAYATNSSFDRFIDIELIGVNPLNAILLRINDKYTVLKNQLNIQKGNETDIEYDESIQETLIDICVYSIIALVIHNVDKSKLRNKNTNCDKYMKIEIRRTYEKYLVNRQKFIVGTDPLQNLKDTSFFGISPHIGCLIRLSDKFLLLKNFMGSENMSHNETLEDTLRDIFSYSNLSIYFINNERK